jgi:hypothetical protein
MKVPTMAAESEQQAMKPMVSALSHRQNSHHELRPKSLVSSKRVGFTPVSTTPAGPAAKTAAPPALSVDGKPATNYGKAVQKAKQVTEANKGTHVDPTKEIMDEQPKK